MDGMKAVKVEALRAASVALFILFFIAAPLLGFAYGTNCALNLGGFVLISPLELILLILGTKSLTMAWLIPGLTVVAVITLFGRFFCGWVCPTGMLLEYTHKVAEARGRNRMVRLGSNRERYAVLLAVLAASLTFEFAAPYLFSPPAAVYRTLVYAVSHGVLGTDLVVLSLFLTLNLLAAPYGRTWCNALCPLGTTVSSLSLVGLVTPRVNPKACLGPSCQNCVRVCPMRIPLMKADRWTMMECTKCLKCWTRCPAKAIRIELIRV